MISINIEKQMIRQPFFKVCLAKEMLSIFEIMFGKRQWLNILMVNPFPLTAPFPPAITLTGLEGFV